MFSGLKIGSLAVFACMFPGVVYGQENPVARQAIISAFTGDDTGMHRAFATAQGQSNSSAVSSGNIALSDAIFYLYDCTRANRDDFLRGQEILAANARDKDWRNRVLLSLLTDEVYELNRLEGQNRFNKYTRIFNRVSTSLSQLVMLQPQAAASFLWDGMYSLRKGKAATTKERKMVFLSEKFLKRYPDAPERKDVVELHTELKTKIINDRAKALVVAGHDAISQGKFQLAEWHLEKAALMKPADADTAQLLAQARTLKVRKEEVLGLTLGVSDSESRMSPEQAKAIGRICRALVAGDVSTLNSLRGNVPYVWDSVDYAYAALSEKAGDHSSALTRLHSTAASAPGSPGGRAAIKLLDNPNFNLNEGYQTALTDMASKKTHFIWTGRRTKEDSVYSAGSATIQNAGNPVAVPVLFGMDAAVRAISEKFKTQVSVEGVVDAGSRYLRRYPDTPRSKDIARQLAELSKKAGDYSRSMDYLQEGGGGTTKEVSKLKENQAVGLYDKSKRSGDLLERRQLLQKLMKDYPESKIAQKSGAKALAELPPGLSNDTIVLPDTALTRDHRLAQYLGVPVNLVDGSNGNGEITKDGVSVTPSLDAVEFKIRNEKTWRRGPLVKQGRDWVLTACRQLRREYMASEEGRQKLYRQKIPFAVDGGIGSSGVDMAPQILPYSTSSEDKKRFN